VNLFAGIALLVLVVVAATILALEAVLGRTPAPVVVPSAPAHARGRAAHPAGHARRRS
jgi:hypothetical protein